MSLLTHPLRTRDRPRSEEKFFLGTAAWFDYNTRTPI